MCAAFIAVAAQAADPASAKATAGQAKKPNVLVIWGDDIGPWNISHNNRGMMTMKEFPPSQVPGDRSLQSLERQIKSMTPGGQ